MQVDSNTGSGLDQEENKELLPGFSSLEEFTKDGYKLLMEGIKISNNLPVGRDWAFYKTHKSFNKITSEKADDLQTIIKLILRKHDIDGNIKNRSLDEKHELVVEANDLLMERVANGVDELNGVRKTTYEPVIMQTVSAQLPINGSWNRVNSATFSVTSSNSTNLSSGNCNTNAISLITAKNIIRPQKFFKDKIVNSSKLPWEPRIKEKHNSLKPLALFLEETENGEEYSHPYEFELEKFEPLAQFMKAEELVQPKALADTPLVEVSTEEQLNELVEKLRGCSEFAVDLEHHSYRTFMGFTCLMQISTKDTDYIIDTLALRDKLWVLNEVFTKPSILKVFHGADFDIQWLQRDLSIYVVNMFDTHQAAKLLEYSGLSLSYLLNKYCNVLANKQFQLADWRIRPLPEELKTYAREDTHYLLYIYQNMKNDLLKKANGQDNLIKSCFQASTEICKKRYFRPVLKEHSHMDFYRRCKKLFDNRQLFALKHLYKWRDELAREEDESTGYVLPNHMMLQIAESLPREMQGILACCNPIPPLVRSNLLELHHIILKAREQPLEKAILKEDARGKGITKKMSKINVDSPLHCPHDLRNSSEVTENLPTLLGCGNKLSFNVDKIEKKKSVYTIFDEVKIGKCEGGNVKFLPPYERYKLVKPFIQEEERIAAEAAKKEEGDDQDNNNKIREHFNELSKRSAEQEAEEAKSLLEMGGSKKRKREEQEEVEIPLVNNLTTPLPNLRGFKRGKKKRKSEEGDEASKNKIPKVESNQSQGKNKKKKKNKGGNFEQNSQRDNKRGRGRGGRGRGRNESQRNDESFVSYDYSSVDFRQFQGGAGSVAKPQQNKHKNPQKKQFKRFNKAQTFEGNNSRGRGRGRRGGN